MKLKKYKLHEMAGERFVIVQGSRTGDRSRVVSMNGTSLYLWNALQDKDFTEKDVVRLLMEHYEVEENVAQKDASGWIGLLSEYGLA
ncbi:MAG: PqqD family protein [Bacteroidales bacterium]|nr:PqqD family protein [Bacteroidales bacterium]